MCHIDNFSILDFNIKFDKINYILKILNMKHSVSQSLIYHKDHSALVRKQKYDTQFLRKLVCHNRLHLENNGKL